MDTIQQIPSKKTFLSFTSVLSKEYLNISKLLRQSGFCKRSGVDILTLFMVFVKSIFCGAYSLQDRYSLKDVETTDCSYYALMRFISNSKHNWEDIDFLQAGDSKDNPSIVSILTSKAGKKIEGLSRTFNHVSKDC